MRAYAGQKSGPGVWRECRFSLLGCNPKSVKNRQGGLKLFFALIFLDTFCIKTKSIDLVSAIPETKNHVYRYIISAIPTRMIN